MIVLIDNYDSFSYNLYQLVGSFKQDIKVVRNDEYTLSKLESLSPSLIIISPGPGKPKDAGICIEAILHFASKVPIFGVCLGHQAISEAFGAKVTYAKELMHGKTSIIDVDTSSCMFYNFPKQIQVARYHSLCALRDNFPKCLKITAMSSSGEIMALEHTQYPIYGVQFHPESIMTPLGKDILANILKDIK
ncbi:MAG: aminodeoxychorismate/anthranilate synthase component II [Helicobacteraceae bacterium]|nr:aminodeoxychorismate/anthranilate synthase component II [Helicobacteraceae bacterium]